MNEDIIRKQLEQGILRITISGNSMLPLYKPGDIVFVKKENDIKENDIVLFYINEKLILHRVVQIIDNYVITKGDNNSNLDKPIKMRRILGVVCEYVH